MNGLERLVGCMEIQRIIKGEKPECIDKLKVKEYGGTHYLYFPSEEK